MAPRTWYFGYVSDEGDVNTWGIGFWRHHIYSGQENFTLWEPEEHHDRRGYTNGG